MSIGTDLNPELARSAEAAGEHPGALLAGILDILVAMAVAAVRGGAIGRSVLLITLGEIAAYGDAKCPPADVGTRAARRLPKQILAAAIAEEMATPKPEPGLADVEPRGMA